MLYYISQTTEKIENGFEAKFLRKSKANKFAWPQVEDVACIDDNNIELVPPEPKTDNWGKISFRLDLTRYVC